MPITHGASRICITAQACSWGARCEEQPATPGAACHPRLLRPLVQVVRYPWYAASLAGGSPAWLTWARYSAFLVLYPVGVVSEMWLLYAGLPAARRRRLHSLALPNGWNFAFDYSYFLVVGPIMLLLRVPSCAFL